MPAGVVLQNVMKTEIVQVLFSTDHDCNLKSHRHFFGFITVRVHPQFAVLIVVVLSTLLLFVRIPSW